MMSIPRMHLFELEDQPWFPAIVRDLATDYLRFVETSFALHRPVVGLLAEALRATKAEHVVDLCSGGGGPIPALHTALADEGVTVDFTLTDRFPNLQAFEQVAAASQGTIAFLTEPVDARAVPDRLRGFRTMFNAFHHFRPADAAAVLRDAAKAGQAIGIFEIPERRLSTLVPLLLLTPLLVALTTPFIRPFRWSRLLWTYVIPMVPLTCWWDGIVSQLRAYTPAELTRLANDVSTDTYSWRAGQVPIASTPGRLTYLLGSPAAAMRADARPDGGGEGEVSIWVHARQKIGLLSHAEGIRSCYPNNRQAITVRTGGRRPCGSSLDCWRL
jgi:hypothetical protein